MLSATTTATTTATTATTAATAENTNKPSTNNLKEHYKTLLNTDSNSLKEALTKQKMISVNATDDQVATETDKIASFLAIYFPDEYQVDLGDIFKELNFDLSQLKGKLTSQQQDQKYQEKKEAASQSLDENSRQIAIHIASLIHFNALLGWQLTEKPNSNTAQALLITDDCYPVTYSDGDSKSAIQNRQKALEQALNEVQKKAQEKTEVNIDVTDSSTDNQMLLHEIQQHSSNNDTKTIIKAFEYPDIVGNILSGFSIQSLQIHKNSQHAFRKEIFKIYNSCREEYQTPLLLLLLLQPVLTKAGLHPAIKGNSAISSFLNMWLLDSICAYITDIDNDKLIFLQQKEKHAKRIGSLFEQDLQGMDIDSVMMTYIKSLSDILLPLYEQPQSSQLNQLT